MEILIAQLTILAILGLAIFLWAINFPNPSPLIKPFLKPKTRWPERQIISWISADRINKGYLSFFNRDPERYPPSTAGLVAPADGLITSAEVRDNVRYLVIALTFWDVHVQRSPAAGEIVSVTKAGTDFVNREGVDFAFLREKKCPVQARIEIRTKGYGNLAVRLITSLWAQRIEVWVEAGNSVSRGDRLGRILLGSTVVLELPPELPLCIKTGQRVAAGETLVAVDW